MDVPAKEANERSFAARLKIILQRKAVKPQDESSQQERQWKTKESAFLGLQEEVNRTRVEKGPQKTIRRNDQNDLKLVLSPAGSISYRSRK